MVFTISIGRPFFMRWLSLIVFFTWSILVRPDYVKLPMIWKNIPEGDFVYYFPGDHKATLALNELGPEQVIFGCGFYCAGIGCKVGSYTFSIFILQNPAIGGISINGDVVPQVVWSANRNHAVGINATLELTREGDLIVKDAEGSVAWSAGTSGKSVVAMNLTDRGNLALLDRNNVTIWQSFNHPTDTLLLGQILKMDQKLTQSVSSSNWTDGGMLSLSLTTEGLLASVESNSSPPLGYYSVNFSVKTSSYIEFVNGGLVFSADSYSNYSVMKLPHASSSIQSMRLGSDGHLRLYKFQYKGMVEIADLFPLDGCRYPTVCGHYGLCSNGNCSCRISSDKITYFDQRDRKHPNRGCSPKTPLICGASKNQTFLEVANVEYFNFFAHLTDVDVEICKDTCMKNCSCKAVFYRVSPDNSRRWCFLPSEVFSLINGTERNGASVSYMTAYIKVQNEMHNISSTPPSNEVARQKNELDTFTKMNNLRILLASFFAAATTAAILVALFVLHKKKKKKKRRLKDVSMEEFVDQIPGLPARFTYAELEEITEEFKKKLGEGGFGSVYEAMLLNKTKVAVKRVDGFEHTKKSFLTEVKTIGSIHHANLIRLLGYCAENSCRLLVYEYMSNGSLDKWIFDKSDGHVPLKWEQRRNIILDVAKGLHYLHEECTQKIIHFDVKPHNILLDGKFHAKVSDFGLSKPIDRDRSRVVTAMKGTPGYLAPEWLRGAITEKVDVYGFGMVILEVVCGRKVYKDAYDEDETDDSILLNLLKSKLAEGCLLDLVDEDIDDVDGTSATRVLRLAAWCLQVDSLKRPSMSTAVKILEGVEDIPEDEIKYNFFSVAEIYNFFRLQSSLMNGRLGVMFRANIEESAEVGASRLSSAVLSGPR